MNRIFILNEQYSESYWKGYFWWKVCKTVSAHESKSNSVWIDS